MKKILSASLCCLLLSFSYVCIAQLSAEEQIKSKDLLKLLQKVENSEWQEREKVITQITRDKTVLTDSVKDKLIEMFEMESKFFEEYVERMRKQGFSINEAHDKFNQEYRKKGYASYFINFANLISSFKDIRAIPALLRGLNYYGGAIVPTHIIIMGEQAVEPLLKLLKSKDRVLRRNVFFVLSVWVNAPKTTEDYSIDENMTIKNTVLLDKIRQCFLEGLHDKDTSVRRRAVYGLAAFPDETVIKSLEEVAKSDPYSFYSKYENKVKHPIREDAKKTIEKIRNKMTKGAQGDK